jgi:tetratricopeptide (TPR) repeat protein
VPVTPQDAPFTEYLTYGFDDRQPDSAVAFLQWEKKKIPFKIEVPNVNDLYVAQMRQDLLSWPGFNYQNWANAARFCADNKINLEEALTWADKAISEPFRGAVVGHESFSTLQTKSAVLRALGREPDANSIMQKAVRLPDAEPTQLYAYGQQLLSDGKKNEAMDVFHLNKQQHPDEKFWTSLGLARGYTALGDKKNAIENWETVIANVPASLSANVPRFKDALQKLKGSS